GQTHDLGHTVRVALRRACAWSGIRPAPKRARPVPSLNATIYGRERGCVRVTHPTAGAGGPRQVNSGAVSGATLDRPETGRVESARRGHQARITGLNRSEGRRSVAGQK